MNLSVCSGILIKAVISNLMVVFALLSSSSSIAEYKLEVHTSFPRSHIVSHQLIVILWEARQCTKFWLNTI